MWMNLADDVTNIFSNLEGCLQPRKGDADWELGDHHSKLNDPHHEADAWIAASEDQRVKLRADAEAKLARIVTYLGRRAVIEGTGLSSSLRYDMAHRAARAKAARDRRAKRPRTVRVTKGRSPRTWKPLSPEQKARKKARITADQAERQRARARRENMSPEKLKAERERMRTYMNAKRAAMTPEQLEASRARDRERMRARRAS